MIKDYSGEPVNFNLLPCLDGCKFYAQHGDRCRHKADCGLDIDMGRGLYYFWTDNDSRPEHRSGGDKQKAFVGYRRWKKYESDY
jgi:hypothetical protein